MREIVAAFALVAVLCERVYTRWYPATPSRRPGEIRDVSRERLRAGMKRETGRSAMGFARPVSDNPTE